MKRSILTFTKIGYPLHFLLKCFFLEWANTYGQERAQRLFSDYNVSAFSTLPLYLEAHQVLNP
ncbi:MAG TPA: hypothetical protein VFF27_07910 [Bacteroidia bacterium]|nr:hypothetical protein [Bacteroidia bacterium]